MTVAPSPRRTELQRLIDFSVQIRHSTTHAVVGTGIVVSDVGEILTCRHVVTLAGIDPLQAEVMTVSILFPKTRTRSEYCDRAAVVKFFPDHDDDIVVLQLQNPPVLAPNEIAVLGTIQDSEGNPFRSYGFRQLGESPSGYATGEILGEVLPFDGKRLLVNPVELRSRDIRPGMSGAGVLDTERNLVVGLVARRWNPGESSVNDNIAWAVDPLVLVDFEDKLLDLLTPNSVPAPETS